jgi:hypothetical protein
MGFRTARRRRVGLNPPSSKGRLWKPPARAVLQNPAKKFIIEIKRIAISGSKTEIEETVDVSRFSSIVVPYTEQELSIRLEGRHITRASGNSEYIIMNAWHWKMLDWIAGGSAKEYADFLRHAENYLKPSGFAATLEWLLEGEYYFYLEQKSETCDAEDDHEVAENA